MNNPQIPERREFLSGVAALGLLGVTGCGGGGDGGGDPMDSGRHMGGGVGSPPAGVAGGGSLRLPANFSGNTLRAAAGAYDLGSGARSGALLFNGPWPSPLIRISSGSALDITLQNQLTESSNIHWHGLAAAAGMDGHLAKPIDAAALYAALSLLSDRTANGVSSSNVPL